MSGELLPADIPSAPIRVNKIVVQGVTGRPIALPKPGRLSRPPSTGYRVAESGGDIVFRACRLRRFLVLRHQRFQSLAEDFTLLSLFGQGIQKGIEDQTLAGRFSRHSR